jgi:hypothetical protein
MKQHSTAFGVAQFSNNHKKSIHQNDKSLDKSKSQVAQFIEEQKGRPESLNKDDLDPLRIHVLIKHLEDQCEAKKPAFVSDHIQYIFSYYDSMESKFRICKEILYFYLPIYKKKMYGLLKAVYVNYGPSLRSIVAGIFLFFHHMSLKRTNLHQLKKFVLASYLLIGLKFHETKIPDLEDFIKLMYGEKLSKSNYLEAIGWIKNNMIACEQIILSEVEFKVLTPHLFEYLEILMYINSKHRNLDRMICAKFINEYMQHPEWLFTDEKGIKGCAIEIFNQVVDYRNYSKHKFD